MALILVIMALIAHIRGPSHSLGFLLCMAIFSIPACMCALLAFAFDIVLMRPGTAYGTWLTLIAAILLVIGTITFFIGRKVEGSRTRLHERVAENGEMAAAPYFHEQSLQESQIKAQDPSALPKFATFEIDRDDDDEKSELYRGLDDRYGYPPGHAPTAAALEENQSSSTAGATGLAMGAGAGAIVGGAIDRQISRENFDSRSIGSGYAFDNQTPGTGAYYANTGKRQQGVPYPDDLVAEYGLPSRPDSRTGSARSLPVDNPHHFMPERTGSLPIDDGLLPPRPPPHALGVNDSDDYISPRANWRRGPDIDRQVSMSLANDLPSKIRPHGNNSIDGGSNLKNVPVYPPPSNDEESNADENDFIHNNGKEMIKPPAPNYMEDSVPQFGLENPPRNYTRTTSSGTERYYRNVSAGSLKALQQRENNPPSPSSDASNYTSVSQRAPNPRSVQRAPPVAPLSINYGSNPMPNPYSPTYGAPQLPKLQFDSDHNSAYGQPTQDYAMSPPLFTGYSSQPPPVMYPNYGRPPPPRKPQVMDNLSGNPDFELPMSTSRRFR